jgi:hypothetical protein
MRALRTPCGGNRKARSESTPNMPASSTSGAVLAATLSHDQRLDRLAVGESLNAWSAMLHGAWTRPVHDPMGASTLQSEPFPAYSAILPCHGGRGLRDQV